MSWLSKICRSRQPPSPFGPNWQFRVAWLTALNQLVLSTQIPWDFDRSESETKLAVACLNLNRH